MLTWGYYVEILHHPSSTLLPFLLQACSLLCVKFLVWKTKKKMFPIIFHKSIIVEITDNGYMSRFTLYLRVWTFSAVCHLILLLTPYGRHDMKSAVMFLLPVFCNYESQPIALWQCQFSTLSALNQFFLSFLRWFSVFSDKFVFGEGHFFELQTTGIENDEFLGPKISLWHWICIKKTFLTML